MSPAVAQLDHAGERRAAREILLLLADADARWGDYASALSLLDAAEAAGEALSPEYRLKRERWARLLAIRRASPWWRRVAA